MSGTLALILGAVGAMVIIGIIIVAGNRRRHPAPSPIAPAPSPSPADLTAAQQRLNLLTQASANLFGAEYLAASQVTAWSQTHGEALALVADTAWLKGLPADLAAAIKHALHPLRDLPAAVKAHNAAFVTRRMAEEAEAFDRVETFPLTARQREAIVTDEDTTLVIAGAGTGKTSTIVGKVDYLLRRNLAPPGEILVLAYNTKAADEVRERLHGMGHRGLEVRTFHSLGNSIITAAGRFKKLSILETDQNARLRFFQACLIDLWSDPASRTLLRDFFVSMLEPLPSDETPRASGPPPKFRAITGQFLRSGQEVQIATWLTLHGIAWDYERPYPIDTATAERRPYLPDFYLPAHDLYLEHFGVDRHGRTRPDINAAQYQAQMAWKRDLHRTHGTRLIETYSYFEGEGGLPHHLEILLRAAGVPVEPLTATEIAALLADTASLTNVLLRLLDQFLQLVDGSGLDLATIQTRAQTPRDHAFLTIFEPIWQRYHAELDRTERIDFNAMINQARAALRDGGYMSRFRYLIVDEFQDISRQRLGLVQDLRAQVPHARLFVVGDDWQAIYRFAGSDISLITTLPQQVGPTARVDLDTTFRYPQEILDASARFVTGNPAQLTKDLRAHAGAAGEPPLVFVHQADATPAAISQALDAAIADIQQRRGGAPGSILILGRYKRLKPGDLEQRQAALKAHDLTIAFQSMHSAKGKEADDVILVGLEDGRLSFPSTIPDDPLVRLVLPAAEAFPFAEERRLFYVALTRARSRVYVITPPAQVSPFVLELDGPAYAPYRTTLVARPPHYACPVCAQETIIRQEGRHGSTWRCVALPACPGQLRVCRACRDGAMVPRVAPEPSEVCSACGVIQVVCPQCRIGVLVERTSQYGVFLACSEWKGGDGCRYTRSLPASSSAPVRRS